MEVAKLAYHQAEIMEEEDDNEKKEEESATSSVAAEEEDENITNSRDVGHNIYILAHQVLPAN